MITKLESRLTIVVIILTSVTFWLFVTIIANAFQQCVEINFDHFVRQAKGYPLRYHFVYSLVLHKMSRKVEEIYLCDVSVLNPFWALTAATCVFARQKHSRDCLRIKANLHSHYKSKQYRIKMIFVHRKHKNRTDYNIAFVKVFRPFIDSRLSYLKFSKWNYQYKINSTVGLLSFGLQNKDSSLSYDIIKKLNLLILDQRYCLQTYRDSKYEITERLLCIGSHIRPTTKLCRYNYGTPVIQNGLLIGIISKETTCDVSNSLVGIFIKMNYYATLQNGLIQKQNDDFVRLKNK